MDVNFVKKFFSFSFLLFRQVSEGNNDESYALKPCVRIQYKRFYVDVRVEMCLPFIHHDLVQMQGEQIERLFIKLHFGTNFITALISRVIFWNCNY